MAISCAIARHYAPKMGKECEHEQHFDHLLGSRLFARIGKRQFRLENVEFFCHLQTHF